MQIVITANLTEEQALILAKEKGYQETVQAYLLNDNGENVPNGDVPNPQSAFEFLKSAYEAMIVFDASKHLVAYENRKTESERNAVEAAIRDSIASSVSSSLS